MTFIRIVTNFLAYLWRGNPSKSLQNDEHPRLSLNDTDTREQIQAKAQAHVKASIAWQSKHYQGWLDNIRLRNDADPSRARGGLKRILQSIWLSIQVPRHRLKWVFGGGLTGIALMVGALCVLSFSTLVDDAIIKEWLKPNSVTGTLLSVLLASPVAFLIWAYRDQNTTWAIENQRKDINLKDFQKLCEWATGQHLIEGKSVESEKSGVDKEGKPISETTVSTETGKRYEESHSLSKVRAAEALQVAAIYQLQAFLEGEFGKQFMRPAFALLLAVYRGLVEAPVSTIRESLLLACDVSFINRDQQLEKFAILRNELLECVNHPVGVAVLNVLVGDGGVRIRLHANELRSGIFHGLASNLQGIRNLYLAGLDMRNFESNGSFLQNVHLQNSNLTSASFSANYMHRVDFTMAQLDYASFDATAVAHFPNTSFVCTNMSRVSCNAATLSGARFEGALLDEGVFRNSQMQHCQFNHAKCRWADFEKAVLQNANFTGADLSNAMFPSADLRLAAINERTILKNCKSNRKTKFGDLPEHINVWDAKDSDYINADRIRAEWIARGAIDVDAVGDE